MVYQSNEYLKCNPQKHAAHRNTVTFLLRLFNGEASPESQTPGGSTSVNIEDRVILTLSSIGQQQKLNKREKKQNSTDQSLLIGNKFKRSEPILVVIIRAMDQHPLGRDKQNVISVTQHCITHMA